MSLLHFALGQVDIVVLHRESPVVGPLLYVTFVFLVIFVAISIFLTIITDAYAAEKADAVVGNLPRVLMQAAGRQRSLIMRSCKRVLYHAVDFLQQQQLRLQSCMPWARPCFGRCVVTMKYIRLNERVASAWICTAASES